MAKFTRVVIPLLIAVLAFETVTLGSLCMEKGDEVVRLRNEYARALLPMNVVSWNEAAKRAAADGFDNMEVVGQVQVASPSGARLTLLQVTYGDHQYGEMFAVTTSTLPVPAAQMEGVPVHSRCNPRNNTCEVVYAQSSQLMQPTWSGGGDAIAMMVR